MQRYYTLRPSRSLAFLLIILCILTLALWWQILSLQWLLMAAIFISVCATAYVFLRDGRLKLRHSCVAFRLEDEDKIVLVLRDGRHLPGRLLLDSVVTPYMVLLNIALADRRGRRSLLILVDGMQQEAFRRLRIALRWGRAKNKSGGWG